MTRYLLPFALSFALASACSSADQSLGETRRPPIPDLDPPPPEPTPVAMLSPCEDGALHARIGSCWPVVEACDGPEILLPGYECKAGTHCCAVRPVGCPQAGCGGLNAGGASNDTPAPPAGGSD